MRTYKNGSDFMIHRTLVLVVLLSLFSMGMTCGSGAQHTPRGPVVPSNPVPDSSQAEELKVGFVFHAENAGAPMTSADQNSTVTGIPLSDIDRDQLLDRMPEIKTKRDDQRSFAIRERSLPPPRTGDTVKDDFPPKQNIEALNVDVSSRPLKVLRGQPVGDVKIAPKITITFSEPMVEVTSHDESIAEGVPAQMTPEMPGTWRWAGTRTLIFEAKPRLPMATEYRVLIPAGTKSANGNVLEEAKEWQFNTPPVTMISYSPSSHQGVGLEPIIRLSFDQDIDPNEVHKLCTLKKRNGDVISLRTLTAAEVKEAGIQEANDETGPRTVHFRASQPLDPDSRFKVTLAKGLSSKEGPRKTVSEQSFEFRTYKPFEFERSSCGNCTRYSSFNISFNNRVDPENVDESLVRISPSVENLKVTSSWRSLHIRGKFQTGTTYKVKVSNDLKDEHGQRLSNKAAAEFTIVPTPPYLILEGSNYKVLDPVGPKEFTVNTVNVKAFEARIYKVRPQDFSKVPNANRTEEPKFPGTLVFKKIIQPEQKLDDMVRTTISLDPALNDEGYGNTIIFVRRTDPPFKAPNWNRKYVQGQNIQWVQVTAMAVDATNDGEKIHIWVSQLEDGQPVAGAKVRASIDGQSATTNEDGYATLKAISNFPGPSSTRRHRWRRNTGLHVVKGQDTAFFPNAIDYARHERGTRTLWSASVDRGLYRPNEEVAVKGWIRRVDMDLGGGIIGPPKAGSEVLYSLIDSRGNKVKSGSTKLSRLGGFDLRFRLPKNMNLGYSILQLKASGNTETVRIRVEEFRRPEFEVNAQSSDGPHLIGSKATVSVEAKYYAGGPLANAESTWVINANRGHYSPPNHPGFNFGVWTPWWGSSSGSNQPDLSSRKLVSGSTDGSGKHHVDLQFESVFPPRPIRISAESTIMDVNRRRMSAKTSLVVHPSELYVGMKTETYFVKQGEPFEIDLIAANIKGDLVAGVPIDVTAHRIVSEWTKGEWKTEEVDEQRCTLTSGEEAVRCTFKTDKGGRYMIRANLKDAQGRPNQSSMSRWVSGASQSRPTKRVEREAVQIIPSKQNLEPGDTAEILVQSPFFPAHGVLRIQRGGIERVEHFTMSESTKVLTIPVGKEHIPGFAVQIEVRGKTDRLNSDEEPDSTLPPRPAFAGARLTFGVSLEIHKIEVEATPAKEKVSPGTKTEVHIRLKDADGKPIANAEAALFVVDESVLALTSHYYRDPLSVFFPYRQTYFIDAYFRSNVWLPDPAKLKASLDMQNGNFGVADSDMEGDRMMESGAVRSGAAPPPSPSSARPKPARRGRVANGGSRPGGSEAPIAVRTDFNPLAAFVPNLKTNARGEVTAKIKLPDNLTRYRIVVLTVAGKDQFGRGSSKITARLPLMVRPSAPRFLNFGDVFEFPVVLQNQTDEAKTVSVAIRGTNVRFTSTTGRQVEIPANDRIEVRFPAEAAEPGIARFQIAAAAGNWADGAELSLPVWTPATTEAFATYGTIDDGAIKQPVKMPGEVIPDFGGLEITTSSTQLQALTDAVLYLATYRFDCSEQMSSRILSIAALRDVLTAFKARGMPSEEKLLASVAQDMRRLKKMQNPDGGFGFWRPDGESWPFLSIHVAHAFTRAKAKGFKVPSSVLSRLMKYVQKIEQHIPSDYPDSVKRVIRAYALYVRAHAEDVDLSAARALVLDGGGINALPMESVGWLYPVFVKSDGAMKERKAIRARLNNLIAETAATAHFTSGYSDGGHLILHSNRRLDGLLLEGLIMDQPESDLIPKIVRGLLAHRTRGRWGNTQENAWVLLGLDRYFNTYEKVTPNFVARAWLGEKFAGQHRFRGRTTDRHQIDVPMRYVAEAGNTDLVLQKDGPGRMYYRIGMNYAPSNLKPPAADHGFAVERVYEGMDDPSDVRQAEDGTWHITAGARVKVTVTMVATERRYHVALVDPLPAGLEPVTPGLRGNQSAPPDVSPSPSHPRIHRSGRRGRSIRRRWRPSWWGPWYRHQNVRDERVEAFTTLLRAGVHTYSYSALATTPGTFVVPPAKAEEMYFPETFGRSEGDRVVVN